MKSSFLKIKPLTLSTYTLPHMDKKGAKLRRNYFVFYFYKQALDLEHLFEEFVRCASPVKDGTGPGLAICQKIIAHHQGTIELLTHHQYSSLFRRTHCSESTVIRAGFPIDSRIAYKLFSKKSASLMGSPHETVKIVR